MILFWIAFVLNSPLGATVGDFLSTPTDHGGLARGMVCASAALLAALVALVVYQTIDVRWRQLDLLATPLNRRTGEPQRPNGTGLSPASARQPSDRLPGSAFSAFVQVPAGTLST